jgi:hypothetical protein
MEYGSSPLSELVAAMGEARAYISAALDLTGADWTLRTIHAVVGAKPPSWKPACWRYQRFMLVADVMAASELLRAFSAERGQSLMIGEVQAAVEACADQASWRRKPSHAPYDAPSLPWPTLDYEISRRAAPPPGSLSAFQIGDDCPSFPDEQSAMRAFFHGDYSSLTRSAIGSYELASIRLVRLEAWIDRVEVSPTWLRVHVLGGDRAGTRVELNGSGLQAHRTVGRSGRVRLELSDGLPDDAWLYLSRNRQWLDYRALGPSLSGSPDRATDERVLPDDPESRLLALLSQGEGPRVEFKRQLPGDTNDLRRKVLKTVAAFANGTGGDIVFGIDPDELTWVGVDEADDHSVRDKLGNVIRRRLVPTPEFEVQVVTVDHKKMLVLSIHAGHSAPYGLQFEVDQQVEYYVRRGASSYPATQAEVRESVLSKLARP